MLFAIGVVLRLRGMNISLWLDEAWVANSVLEDSLHGMYYYDRWLQTSPPGFLLLVRMATAIGGTANFVWRVVPFLSGVIAMGAVLALSRRMLKPVFAVAAMVVFALAPNAIHYSFNLKQYSTELMCSAVLFLAALAHLQAPTRRTRLLLLAAVPASAVLGYGPALLLPALLLVLIPEWEGGRISGYGFRWAAAGAVLAAFSYGLVYWLFVTPNSNDSLKDFWFAGRQGGGWMFVLRARVMILLDMLPLPDPSMARNLLKGVCMLILPAGVLAGLRKGLQKETAALAVAALPCLGALTADLLKIYPAGPGTWLFLLPAFTYWLTGSMQLADEWLREQWSSRVWQTAVLGGWMALMTAMSALALGTYLEAPRPSEDNEKAVEFLRRNVGWADALYVSASTEEGFRLYARENAPKAGTRIAGDVGWPCCARNWRPRSEEPAKRIQEDLLGRLPAEFRGRLWTLSSIRPFQMDPLDEQQGGLAARGCELAGTTRFEALAVREFRCR